MAETSATAGHATGGVRWMLRLEGLALFLLAAGLYAAAGGPWWLFLLLFLAPDLAFLAYLAGPRIGAGVYNAAHSLIGPLAFGAAGFYLAAAPPLLWVALIWLAHTGIDRALGFGLKYASGFADTHLGRIGRIGRGAAP